jgi:mannose-6-phosphate isomerase
MENDHRPWGYYTVLADEDSHKVKKIVVFPGQRISLQRHSQRSEHWLIIQGKALITKNSEEFQLEAGSCVDIPRLSWHRITNPGQEPVVFIEIQTGDYFGEDDIERSEDDYGRI